MKNGRIRGNSQRRTVSLGSSRRLGWLSVLGAILELRLSYPGALGLHTP